MSLRITELTFLEHFSSRYGIPVPRYLAGDTSRDRVKGALEQWNHKAIVKPDVLAGRRGKSGAICAVENVHDALRELKRISAAEIDGEPARTAYLEEYIPAAYEMFTAATYNSEYLGPSFTVSLHGGINIEEVPESCKATIPIDIYQGLDAYQASEILVRLGCIQEHISTLSRAMISFWDLFISTGMESAEINPWRVTSDGKPFACDFKAIVDEANYKSRVPGLVYPDYAEEKSELEEEMSAWDATSHQGQAHLSDLGGKGILPLLFGGGVSTIITETLEAAGGDPMFLSDFGGNPPYERMLGTAQICFKHRLSDTKLLLILGGKANNTFIDVTFQAIADALVRHVEENGPIRVAVIIGRGGPRLAHGMLAMKHALDFLGLPYVIFGPETPVTMVAEYAARLMKSLAVDPGETS